MNYELCISTAKKITDCKDSWTFEENCIVVENEKFPLLPWRFDRRLKEMRALISPKGAESNMCSYKNGAIKTICSYKSVTIERKNRKIDELLIRELDLCEWFTDDVIESIYALSNGRTLNAVIKTKGSVVCAVDIAATLSEESSPVTRHEIVGVEGMITDRSINEQIPVEAVYMFTDSEKFPQTFTDMDFAMFGLTPEETAFTDDILDILKTRSSLRRSRMIRLNYLSECVKKSIKSGEKVFTEAENL